MAALTQNNSFGEDHGLLPSADILAMATVNGARALRRDAGVIAAGKMADLILLDVGPRPNPPGLALGLPSFARDGPVEGWGQPKIWGRA